MRSVKSRHNRFKRAPFPVGCEKSLKTRFCGVDWYTNLLILKNCEYRRASYIMGTSRVIQAYNHFHVWLYIRFERGNVLIRDNLLSCWSAWTENVFFRIVVEKSRGQTIMIYKELFLEIREAEYTFASNVLFLEHRYNTQVTKCWEVKHHNAVSTFDDTLRFHNS